MPKSLKLNDRVVCRMLDDEAMLLDLRTGVYFGLDALGARIWRLLAARRAPAAVLATLRKEYAADAATLERDLARFLARLCERGLARSEA